jgi:hypothetical protein
VTPRLRSVYNTNQNCINTSPTNNRNTEKAETCAEKFRPTPAPRFNEIFQMIRLGKNFLLSHHDKRKHNIIFISRKNIFLKLIGSVGDPDPPWKADPCPYHV